MDHILQYRIKNVYGVDRKYPANPFAEMIAKIEGGKTLSDKTLKDAQGFGFKVEQVI